MFRFLYINNSLMFHQIFYYPPHSSMMNPIEIWFSKGKMNTELYKETAIDELKAKVERAFKSISKSECEYYYNCVKCIEGS